MRKLIAVVVLLLLALPMQDAAAAEFTACWTASEWDPVRLRDTPVTRCRIAGGDTIDYASDSSVPSVLYPNLGTDLTGQCWYLTSAATAYVILSRYADGSAEIGLDTDPGNPGGIVALGPVVPRCTSEPVPATDPGSDAWNYVMSYIHDPPTPELNPAPGDGVTGLETYVAVAIPDDHAARLSSGSSTIEVEISVAAVAVSWGDGTSDLYPPLPSILSGFPEGAATHVYEVKDPEGVSITVEYDWTARWRLIGGGWTPLDVPNTATSVDYPVAEIISHLRE